tara:strand:+ start:138 stop:368 length:231 start_codon:yes stop_codon:yes gene_type:complete
MNKIIKFPARKQRSERFLSKVSPLAIAKYITRKEINISWRAARAIADAEIATVYRDLVLEEERQGLNQDIIEGIYE